MRWGLYFAGGVSVTVVRHVESGAFVGRAGLRRVVVLDHPEVEVTYGSTVDLVAIVGCAA